MRITITGTVQGIGFRPFIYKLAVANNLRGFIRNRKDAAVEIAIQGDKNDIHRFLQEIREKKLALAWYNDFLIDWCDDEEEYHGFSILASSEDRGISGSAISPDIAICKECIRELHDTRDRRQHYAFNTCAECGPRFTIIESLPYDRAKTTMSDFNLCEQCRKEYEDPFNRRFHAQTLSCKNCGPKLSITNNDGKIIDVRDPVSHAAKLLKEGAIVAVKGLGGFHLATSALNTETIERLRERKKRGNKPFAVMARDLDSVRSFAMLGHAEADLLTSYVKPIVLLGKRIDCHLLSPAISPQLHNIAVMLPYASLHIMLLEALQELPALVMTSANPGNEPLVKDNEEAIGRIGSIADCFLLHNRRIATRCDDSVLKVNNGRTCIIRRSRGYVPSPVPLKNHVPACILALGAELNDTFAIALDDKAFLSQHIGDVDNLENYMFLKNEIDRLLTLMNTKPEAIACDLHPSMHTTRLAYLMAVNDDDHDEDEENYDDGSPVIQVQHHHAHAASLMAEHGLEEIACIVCDGAGYGLDGKIWGGEVISCDRNGFKRAGNLTEQPMIGGDLATHYPLRMVTAMLYNKAEGLEDYIYSKSHYFPFGKREVEFIIENIRKPSTVTTSTGRVLDAVSSILGICYKRTFEGEPAMKLESVALNGTDIGGIEPRINQSILDTTFLVQYLFENKDRYPVKDLACTSHSYLAKGLASIACDQAQKAGVKVVGFSGGVAYNELFSRFLKQEVESAGMQFVQHEKVPPGDGGISLGQAYVAGRSINS